MNFDSLKRTLVAGYRLLVPVNPTPFRMAVTFSLVVGTLFAGSAIVERFQTRHGQIETATVIAKERTFDKPTCWMARGPNEYAHDYTWKSQNPPAGMPAEFVDRERCETWRVGEPIDIIRRVKNDELIVTTYAFADNREVAEMIGFTYAILFGLAYLGAWVIRLGQRLIIQPLGRLWRKIRLRL